MEFKVGDKARVIANKFNHSFELGDIVNIISVDRNYYRCSIGANYCWLAGEELAHIESSIVIKENTGIKDFAMQVVKYLQDHYGEHNYKAFLEVVNSKLKSL